MDEITKREDFFSIINNGIVLVDFFTEWCGPCKVQAKILKEIATELGREIDGLKMFKLDCDILSDIADEYNIRSIPSLIFFQNGKAHQMEPGVKRKEEIIEFSRKHLDLTASLMATFIDEAKRAFKYATQLSLKVKQFEEGLLNLEQKCFTEEQETMIAEIKGRIAQLYSSICLDIINSIKNTKVEMIIELRQEMRS